MQIGRRSSLFYPKPIRPNPSSAVYFIGGEGVEASLTDRETWVVAATLEVFQPYFLNLELAAEKPHILWP